MSGVLLFRDCESAIFYIISRPLWGVALSLMAFSLRFIGGYQVSVIKEFLSRDLYQSLSQLTYSGYLVQMVIFWWWIWDSNDEMLSVYNDGGYTLFTTLGMYGLTMSAALILWFVVERPTRNLTNHLIKALVAR